MKRFTDTDLWNKPWFSELTPAEKLAWFFIKDSCDNVGVWTPHFKLAEFQIGTQLDWEKFVDKCHGNIKILQDGKWWLVDFCRFQHPDLYPEAQNSGSKAVQSYIRDLKQHGLWDDFVHAYSMPIECPPDGHTGGIECPQGKGKGKGKGKGTGKGKPWDRPDVKERAQRVWLSDEEYARLTQEYPVKNVESVIEDLSLALGNKYPTDYYADHNLTIRGWLKRRGVQKVKEKPTKKICPKCGAEYRLNYCQSCDWTG